MHKLKLLPLLFITFMLTFSVRAQVESDERALLAIQDGISFSKNDVFLLNLRFRIQNRVGVNTFSGSDLGVDRIEALVRRARLRFDGYVLSPKISYYVQLSFSKNDQDLERGTIAQTVRDAMVYYTFNEDFYIGFGQSKLPGNRQRVISSGNLQFADRSFANARMTIDRDFGLFAYYTLRPASQLLILKGALTTGDGRNASTGNNGIAYTWRAEWLPFGAFKGSGDYSEGDLAFETSPKVSISGGQSANKRAYRTGGQLGLDLFEERDIHTTIVDGVFKYMGWAVSTEYFWRNTNGISAITTSPVGDVRFVNTGHAYNWQASKMITTKTEIAARFTELDSDKEIMHLDPDRLSVMTGVSRYLNGHRIKLQGHVGYEWLPEAQPGFKKDFWFAMFQVEFGI
jgi:phosphate-selective porin OprO and OprP